MTRKDFELIASALFAARLDCRSGIVGGDGGSYLENAEAGVGAVVDQMVARLVETNIRFDAGRFRKACGE